VWTSALPFFDKRPEFIQLAFGQVIVVNQMLTDFFTMTSRRLKNERDRVLVNIKDSGAGTHAVAFGQGFEHAIDGLFIGMKTSKDACVTTTESPATFRTPVERSAMRSVKLNKLEICLNGFASVRATQRGC
jgi:hypothetical protein